MIRHISPMVIGSVDEDGVFKADDEREHKQAYRVHAKRRVVLIVKRFQKRISKASRGYYFGVVVLYWMRKYGEHDPEAMHDMLKVLYNYKPVLFGAEVLRIPLSTADDEMGQEDFSVFVDKCRAGYSLEYGEDIPDPKSQISIQMIEEYNALGNAKYGRGR